MGVICGALLTHRKGLSEVGYYGLIDDDIHDIMHSFYFIDQKYASRKVIFKDLLFYNPTERKFACKDVVEGMEYEFRVSAINISGAGEPSTPSEFVFARDPKSELNARFHISS